MRAATDCNPDAASVRRELTVDVAIYAAAAAFAAINAGWARLLPHQLWGRWAVWGLATGLIASGVLALSRRQPAPTTARVRMVLVVIVALTSVVVPMIQLSVERADLPQGTDQPVGTAQSEVIVIEAMADRLWQSGSPYLDPAEARAESARPRVGFRAYAPYQPAMAVFGVPRIAAYSWLTDARVMFLVTTALIAAIAVRLGRLDPVRTTQLLTIVPPAGLTLATGGDDLPVIALCVAAFAAASRRRWWWAGLAVGAALAIKLTAAPVALTLIVLAGRRHWRHVALPAIGLPAATLVPVLAADPSGVIENLLRYPLGLTAIRSTAKSPLPGVWLSEHVTGGRPIAIAIVAITAIMTGWLLWRRPPRTAAHAAWFAAATMAAAVAFAPAARFGYLLYPITFAAVGAMMARNDTDSDRGDERGSDSPGDPDVLRRDGRGSARAPSTSGNARTVCR